MTELCCVRVLSLDEQASTPFSWFQFFAHTDQRKNDNSVTKIVWYPICCPIIFLFRNIGIAYAGNYETIGSSNPSIQDESRHEWFHPPTCLAPCLDSRKWVWWKHYCCYCIDPGPNSYDQGFGVTGLHVAVIFGNLQTTKYYHNYGDDINGKTQKTKDRNDFSNCSEESPLHLACLKKHKHIIKYLVLQGAIINQPNSEGLTAMHYACQNNLIDSIELLVSYGGNLFSDQGPHPADYLQKDPTNDFLQRLSSLQGFELVSTASTLMEAVRTGHVASVLLFLENGDAVDVASLVEAVKLCKKTVALLLLRRIDAAFLRFESEETSATLLRWAVEDGKKNLVQLLIDCRADVNAKVTRNHDTPLHLAIARDHLEIVTYLIEHAASLEAKNSDNKVWFECFPSTESKHRFILDTAFSRELLFSSQCSFWFYLVKIKTSDVPGISERVKSFTKEYQDLIFVKDDNGRRPEDVASAECCDAIRQTYLWNGRYRPDPRPVHVSATCFVYRCVDEMDVGSLGLPRRVAVKLMRRRDQWQREIDIRKLIEGSKCVLEHLRTHFPKEELPEIEMEEVRNKEDAERMYAIVMPLADQDMFDAIKHDSWAGKEGLETAREYFLQVARAVNELHKKRVLHADLKSLNLVHQEHWLLIDMDASCRIGVDFVGFKSSTAIMPPEAFYKTPDGSAVVVRTEENRAKYPGCRLVLALPSFDVWSLGVLLYQISNPDALELFKSNKRDNLSTERSEDDSVWRLEEWSDETKRAKLAKVADAQMRNLLSLMLSKDHSRRPTIERILAHPALSRRSATRPGGSAPRWDVFISYREASEGPNGNNMAQKIFKLLESLGLRVWRDIERLKPGDDWQQKFTSALTSSRICLCLLSKGAMARYLTLTSDSGCDNVLLEHSLALELKDMGYLEAIMPLLIGEKQTGTYSKFSPDFKQMPQVSVKEVENKLCEHMERECLGSPLRALRTVKSVYSDILAYQAQTVEGEEAGALTAVATAVVELLERMDAPGPLGPSLECQLCRRRCSCK